jgi:maleamate amidohydrolase
MLITRAADQQRQNTEAFVMSERIWDKFLTDEDKAVFATSGYGAQGGFGKRPAVLVIDVSYNFCGDRPEPILESIKRWPNSCGERAWAGVAAIRKLLDTARTKGLPIIYTTNAYRPDRWDLGIFRTKNARFREWSSGTGSTNLDGDAIVAEIAPGPQDILVLKQMPSAFHGTRLLSYLTFLGCDSVIVTGTTTSGCVRASVIEAFSYNFRVIVAEEGCFDRSQASHAINLCDMNAKYADVISTDEVIKYLNALPRDQFDLPSGVPVE